MVKTNRKMDNILENINNTKLKGIKTCKLLGVLFPNFIEVEECILLKNFNEIIEQLNIDFIYKAYGDKTGYEASCNHIHIPCDSKTLGEDFIDIFKLAIKIIEIWEKALKKGFPYYNFHLILVWNEQNLSLRFHRFRVEEGAWLDIDNLENYKNEAILVKEI